MYLARGSGLFWNCGISLRARNKVAAAVQLTEELSPLLPQNKVKGTAAETLSLAIESNDAIACDKDHCEAFMKIFTSTRVDRNDNCYGTCPLSDAPLAMWLQRVADGTSPRNWKWDHMSASSVFDHIITYWSKRVGYDSVQLTMQPQVWCGFTWTSEVLDLRVRRHRPLDLVPFLGLRDPLQSLHSKSAPCIGELCDCR